MHLKFIFTLISVLSFHQSANSCEKLDTMYLDPEIILNKGSRDLGIKVLDARAVRSPDFKNFYFVQYKLDTPVLVNLILFT